MRIFAMAVALASAPVAAAVEQDGPQNAPASRAEAIDQALRQNIFDPAILRTENYARIQTEAAALSQSTPDTAAFVRAYNRLWRTGPVSHVRLAQARASAQDTAATLDRMEAGPDALRLEWRDDIAILTVNTMMGADTIARAHAAMVEVATRPARALIVDLRANEGGAFVGVEIAAHLIDRPYDAGALYSRRWVAAAHDQPPSRQQVDRLPVWTGWSIRAFWRDVSAQPATRIQFRPEGPRFNGPVYVLTSRQTASAAEMTADALAGSGAATLIGEPTAGQMLSQMPFDLPGGLQLFAPIANYVSWHSGVIEGRGVTPGISVSAADAMTAALAQLGR